MENKRDGIYDDVKDRKNNGKGKAMGRKSNWKETQRSGKTKRWKSKGK